MPLKQAILFLGVVLSLVAPACPETLARIATHIDFSTLTAEEAASLKDYGETLAHVLDGDSELERALSGILSLDPLMARQIVTRFVGYEPLLRIALIKRLRWLQHWGNAEQRRRFLLNIPLMKEPLRLTESRALGAHRELDSWLARAAEGLDTAGSDTLQHIVGERSLSAGGPLSAGGGHTLSGWERLADDRINSWPQDQKAWFEEYVSRIDISHEGYEFFLGFLQENGFDLSRRGWARHLVAEQHLWGVEKRENGVICLWLPRPLFNAKAWKATVQSARHGKSPIGGKSVFPVSWSLDRIRATGSAVLRDPKSILLTPTISPTNPAYYVRGTHDGVVIDIGLEADKVKTLFPAWRQTLPPTLGRAYLEWWSAHDRVVEMAAHINFRKIASHQLKTPMTLALLYLGRDNTGLSEQDHAALSAWLDPRLLPDASHTPTARSFQSVTFQWLSRERVVREMEGVEGALFQAASP